jgi:hypothetical protein
LADIIDDAFVEPPPAFVAEGQSLLASPSTAMLPEGVGAAVVRVHRIASEVYVVTVCFCFASPPTLDLGVTDRIPEIGAGVTKLVQARAAALCQEWMQRYLPGFWSGLKASDVKSGRPSVQFAQTEGLNALFRKLMANPLDATRVLQVATLRDHWMLTASDFRPVHLTLAASAADPGGRMLLVGDATEIEAMFEPARLSSPPGLEQQNTYNRLAVVDRVLAIRTYAAWVANIDATLNDMATRVGTLGDKWRTSQASEVTELLAAHFRMTATATDAVRLELEPAPQVSSGIMRNVLIMPSNRAHPRSLNADLEWQGREQLTRLSQRMRAKHQIVTTDVLALNNTLLAREGFTVSEHAAQVSQDSRDLGKWSVFVSLVALAVSIVSAFTSFAVRPDETQPVPPPGVRSNTGGQQPTSSVPPGPQSDASGKASAQKDTPSARNAREKLELDSSSRTAGPQGRPTGANAPKD